MIDREQFDDLLSARMARYDEALAGDTAPPDWDESLADVDPELASEWEQAKSCLELLDRARRGGLSLTGDLSARAAFPGRDAAGAPSQLGRFRIERELGRGGLGIVYLAHDPQLSRKVALKIPRVDVVAHGDSQRRFLREAEAASRLSHPNIVSLYEVGQDGSTCYLACEYCTGPTLSQWLRRRSERVDAREAATIVLRLAEAVEHAHSRGVLHRDIKPGNVMLSGADDARSDRDSTDCEEFIPKLTDFGLAKLTEQDGGETRTGAVLGTLAYMSPEQAEGRLAELDSRTDVYALGAILYELLTGAAPFVGKGDADTLRQLLLGELVTPRRVREDLSRDLEAITMKCLASRPADRYATAREVALDLARFLAGEPTLARPVAAWERVLKWTRRRPAVAALVAVSTLAAISLLGVGAIYSARLEVAHGRSRQLLYAADMKTGFDGYLAGHLPTVEQRLENYRSEGADLQTFAWRLLDTLSRPAQRILYEHSAPALSLAWSPDGRFVASGGRDYVVRLMDLERSQVLPPLEGHAEDINSLAFSPDGRLLASASDDRTVRVWSLDGSARVRVLSEFSDLSAYGVTFSPDGRYLVVGSEDALVRVWNTSDWTLAKSWSHHRARVNRVAFSADGSRLVTCSHDGTAQVLDFPAGKVLSVCEVAREPGHAVDCAAISPDGRTVATCCIEEQSFALWSADTGKRNTSSKGHDNTIYSLAFSADGRLVAGALRSGAIRVWDAVNRETRHMLLAHQAVARDVRFSPRGDTLVSCGIDGQVQLLELESEDRRESQCATIHPVKAVAFQPGGRHVAYLETNGEAVLLDAASGNPKLRIQTGEVGPRALAAFSGGGAHFAYAAEAGRELRVLHVASRDVQARLPFADAPILAAAFIDHDQRLLCSDTGGALSVWEVASGRRLGQTPTAQREIFAILPLASRGMVATIDPTGARLRDVQSLELRSELPRFLDKLSPAAACAPDDSTIVAGTTTGKVVVWNLATGGTRSDLVAHEGQVLALAYCPGGDTFASCGADGKVYLWDHRTLQQVGELSFHAGTAQSVAFSPDGTTAALGGSRSNGGMLRFWSADPGCGWTCSSANDKPIIHDLLGAGGRGRCYEIAGHFVLDSPDAANATLHIDDGTLAKFNLTSTVGGQDQGRLTLGRGAQVEANEELFVGRSPGSLGQLTLQDASQWRSNHYVTVADAGRGELSALGGASITSGRVHVGYEASAHGFVDLQGSGTCWTSHTICTIGGFGHGGVRLTDGARLLVERDITIGSYEGSYGEVTLADAGSKVRTADLFIGDRGRAALHVLRGANLDCQKVVMAQRDGRGDLSVTGTGSRFDCRGPMFVAGNAMRAGGHDASVLVGPGAMLTVGEVLRIWKQGTLGIDGGSLDVHTLDVASGGVIDWRGGTMVCRDAATLRGRLDLSNHPALSGAIGQVVPVLSYESRKGEFQLTGVPPDVVVEAQYGQKQLSLKVSAKPGA